MIINYPTGMYKNAIDDNITWHISSNPPQTVFRTYIQIPAVESIRPLPDRVHESSRRRGSKGSLVFSVNEAHGSIAENGKKQYAEGEVLEFGDVNIIDIDMPPNSRIESRHNTNILDLESMGLSSDQVDGLYDRATRKRKLLDESYKYVRSEIENLEKNISNVQKSINEVNKAIAAVSVIGDDIIIESLNEKLESLNDDMQSYVSQHRTKVVESESIIEQIRQVNEMIK